jgi:hypothetical protein
MSNYEAHGKSCVCCGLKGNGLVTYHHIYRRKTYPEFAAEEFNQIPVCLKHHNETHNSGERTMAVKYPGFRFWLEEKDYYFCEVRYKWANPKAEKQNERN